MKEIGKGLLGVLTIAAVFLFDYTVDYPDWTQLPGMWDCNQEPHAWFRWCGF